VKKIPAVVTFDKKDLQGPHVAARTTNLPRVKKETKIRIQLHGIRSLHLDSQALVYIQSCNQTTLAATVSEQE